jgi:predicted ribosome quality control (RQC) complex YloA/Tae2 family protein
MLTDWALVRRLGAEIESRLRGARLQDAGMLADGRLALLFWQRKTTALLCVDAFDSPPVMTLESGELGTTDTGFSRMLARTLRGMTLQHVLAKRGDRLLRFVFAIRSRFGITDEVDLWVELVPRFGNAVAVKSGRVLGALKEFSLAQNPSRAIAPGVAYAPPPLPSTEPALPRVLAESGADPIQALAFLESDEALRVPLYAYRRDGKLLQAHLLPLSQFAGTEETRENSLLEILRELRNARVESDAQGSSAKRRAVVLRRVEQRLRALERIAGQLVARRAEVEARAELRAEGERIFATLHELDPAARDRAKERARALFADYRKLSNAASHLDKRERALRVQREAIETLAWEAQRAGDEQLDDVEDAVAALDRQPKAAAHRRLRRNVRAALEFRTKENARVLVGRSPLENAELTFRTARPSDLWFHARGVPGAHVILSRDDRAAPSEEDIAFAASLAAGHSRARESAKVVVDYTQRKFVRKRRDAPPGTVFYTEAKSITVVPRP